MRPKVKYAVIYRHRGEYPIAVMCKFFEVSRSGYYDFVKRQGKPERDADLAEKIRECQSTTDKTYGYRRVWLWLEGKNIHRNPKTILKVMRKYGLLSEIRRSRKWVNLVLDTIRLAMRREEKKVAAELQLHSDLYIHRKHILS